MGHCLVVYDTSHDRTRTKVADTCLDYGLDRIQYSAFLGILSRTHQEEVMLKLAELLGERQGNIQLFPLCAKDWQARQVLENVGDDADDPEEDTPRVETADIEDSDASSHDAVLGEAIPGVRAIAMDGGET